ncbi:DegT/DnrJ/EryC1/StrS aminotransferase family protein [uncultured Tateyamaria sp.]|uniref:DegT/DnrJ/EryC1/StrS family aminotransferase n=1 Tax=uncultured Tateyamaria sp. TaxID=455651 RepID=UPI0026143BB0|nr:DegT/DnrJ/EryC1/StrS family aminotransferase [uncultured Tateyamaria sp.]
MIVPHDPLYVTRPTLPPRDDIEDLLKEIWDSRFLTNRGPLLQRFETELERYLDVPHVSLVANATLGCMVALRSLGIDQGEVITPAFSFVATAHAARWVGFNLVFADIDPVTLNLDPKDVERRITPRTRAIFPVHCYANPCDVEALAEIGARHNIPVIYDGAHCFGAVDEGGSLLRHGDLSVVSFHATKVFSTFEGGAIISHDAKTKQLIDRLCNYGIVDETQIEALGLNAKMSELHAALGLAQLPYVASDIEKRAGVSQRYWDQMSGIPGVTCVCPPNRAGLNYYSFPILVGQQYPMSRDILYQKLQDVGVHARKYFYPLLADLPMYSDVSPGGLDNARRASEQVLCLPLYPDLASTDQDRIIACICDPCG